MSAGLRSSAGCRKLWTWRSPGSTQCPSSMVIPWRAAPQHKKYSRELGQEGSTSLRAWLLASCRTAASAPAGSQPTIASPACRPLQEGCSEPGTAAAPRAVPGTPRGGQGGLGRGGCQTPAPRSRNPGLRVERTAITVPGHGRTLGPGTCGRGESCMCCCLCRSGAGEMGPAVRSQQPGAPDGGDGWPAAGGAAGAALHHHPVLLGQGLRGGGGQTRLQRRDG